VGVENRGLHRRRKDERRFLTEDGFSIQAAAAPLCLQPESQSIEGPSSSTSRREQIYNIVIFDNRIQVVHVQYVLTIDQDNNSFSQSLIVVNHLLKDCVIIQNIFYLDQQPVHVDLVDINIQLAGASATTKYGMKFYLDHF